MLSLRKTLRTMLVATALPASWLLAEDAVPENVSEAAAVDPTIDAPKLEYFEKHVRPLLVGKCYTCHSAETKPSGGLRVDDRVGLLEGGSSGAAVVPGDPDGSLLVQAIEYSSGMDMPPEQKLSDEEIAVLRRWIADGAIWPVEEAPIVSERNEEKYAELRANHWAYRPVSKPPVPVDSSGSDWAKTDVDRFVKQKLDEQGLTPAVDADKATLLRRVSFDLTGLPPEEQDVEAFLADESEEAFERVVDRLLASPAFGERWGRHWLDVARYGESTGSARNVPYPEAWRYRDYVIESFNEDKPFDLFIKEQIAGDLLPSESDAERDERRIATGFLAIGVKDVNQRFKVRFLMDNVDEQIDAVSRSFLGLTVSCARCHDHKFDPVPASDYYALAGIFRSTDLCAGVRNKMGGSGLDYFDDKMLLALTTVPGEKADPAAIAAAEEAVEKTKAAFEALKDSPEGQEKAPNGRPKRQVAQNKMKAAQATLKALRGKQERGAVAIGVREGSEIRDTELRIRGEAEKLGPVVPRGFLSAFEVPDAPAIDPSTSGRRELAEWIASPQNPLTARVAVNRVWSRLFGNGLVRTVDNFGVTGDAPSHPELLDWLAATFVEEGQSTKSLIRRLALSRTYRLSSSANDSGLEQDPGNRWLWRRSPRRLDAEEIRDAMLVAAGSLNACPPTGSPVASLEVREIDDDGPEAGRVIASATSTDLRSVYLPLLRRVTPAPLAVFDFAEQGMVTGQRDETTVPTQALYLLNDPFVRKQSERLTDQVLSRGVGSLREVAALAYERAWGREATAEELSRAEAFLQEYRAHVETSLAEATVSDESTESATSPDVEPLPPATDPQPVAETHANREAVAAFAQALFGAAEFRYLR